MMAKTNRSTRQRPTNGGAIEPSGPTPEEETSQAQGKGKRDATRASQKHNGSKGRGGSLNKSREEGKKSTEEEDGKEDKGKGTNTGKSHNLHTDPQSRILLVP